MTVAGKFIGSQWDSVLTMGGVSIYNGAVPGKQCQLEMGVMSQASGHPGNGLASLWSGGSHVAATAMQRKTRLDIAALACGKGQIPTPKRSSRWTCSTLALLLKMKTES